MIRDQFSPWSKNQSVKINS